MAIINYLTRIRFDHGALSVLSEELATLGVRHPMIVTDSGLMSSGLVERLLASLPDGVEATVFDGTPQNPTETAAGLAHTLYAEAGCDGVIGFGGGSSLDLAKAAALLATHDGPLVQYAVAEGGVARIRPDTAPMIAIPTTAGTGSEVGRGAIIVFEDGRKMGVVSPYLIPDVAICDPDLTLDLPAGLTAATGLDALAHCIETFISPEINPPAEAIALDGARRAIGNLERAVADGHDREARWQMMMAAMEGAMAFQKGLGAVHALSHALGAIREVTLHHGTLNAVLMPAVLRFNADHVGDKYATLGQALGVEDPARLPEWAEDINRQLDMPSGLAAMGVDAAWLPAIADAAKQDHCDLTNPRAASEADYLRLMEDSMG